MRTQIIVLNEMGQDRETETLRKAAEALDERRNSRVMRLGFTAGALIVGWIAAKAIIAEGPSSWAITAGAGVLLVLALVLAMQMRWRHIIHCGERAAANICATMAFLRLDWEIRHTSNGPLLFRMTYLNGRMRIDYHDDPE